MILAIRTDKPEAELYLYETDKVVDSYTWQAHRQLSDTLLIKIEELLSRNSKQQSDLTGIISYQGPGSFTGLRIGVTVANALAYALNIPVHASGGEDWLQTAVQEIGQQSTFTHSAVPDYGSEVRITAPQK